MPAIRYTKGPIGLAVSVDGRPVGVIKDLRRSARCWQVSVTGLKATVEATTAARRKGRTVFATLTEAKAAVEKHFASTYASLDERVRAESLIIELLQQNGFRRDGQSLGRYVYTESGLPIQMNNRKRYINADAVRVTIGILTTFFYRSLGDGNAEKIAHHSTRDFDAIKQTLASL